MRKTLDTLKRYPQRKNELLQAWDSADELILQHLNEVELLLGLREKRILILNDHFGALSCSLQDFNITTYTDSFVSSRAIELNSGGHIKTLSQLGDLTGIYDYVLIQIPKNMSFFEDMLCHLSGHLNANSKIICGYMVKYQTKASFDLLSRIIGETSTSLAQKKARLIFAKFQRAEIASPYPLQVPIESFEFPFIHHSNLFSREKLDIGTRFLLEHLPQGNYQTLLDLGCANGVIGIAAKRLNPSAKIIFSDESRMAIQSAEANYARYFRDQAEFHWIHSYEDQAPASLDLVICNPPFHQGNAMGDFIAWQMFKDSHHALSKGGVLRVIGNSHLLYPSTLKKLFGNSEIVAKNQKFTIVDAIK